MLVIGQPNVMLCGLWKRFLCEYDTHLLVLVWDEETESELESEALHFKMRIRNQKPRAHNHLSKRTTSPALRARNPGTVEAKTTQVWGNKSNKSTVWIKEQKRRSKYDGVKRGTKNHNGGETQKND